MKKLALILSFFLASYSLLAQSVLVTSNLAGRDVKSGSLSIPEYDFSEDGVVVVSVEVDRNGNVVRASAGIEGTTLKSASLWTKCRKAAQTALFEEEKSAEEIEYGKIVYTFYSLSNDSEPESSSASSTNPLAGSNLSDAFSLLDKPIEYQGAKKFKIFQVIAKDGALAESEDTRYSSFESYGDPIVLLISDHANVYYDDLIVSVKSKQKTIQLGTYRYETRMEVTKTVPIVMVVDK